MRAALNALTDELRRLKTAGVKTVAVSEESLAALRAALQGEDGDAPAPVPALRAEKTLAPPAPAGAGRTPRPPAETFPAAPVVNLPAGDKAARWSALTELVRNDPVCRAHLRPGKKAVLGVGNLDAKIMFVGEAPGAEEEVQGEPFVGPAGQLLNRMIVATGLARADVYIGNIMNWRPEMAPDQNGVQFGNRPPTPAEMAYCLPYLRAQIEIVNPDILVALGASAATGLLGAGAFRALSEVRGQWRDYGGKPLIVTYHPSYILRNPTNKSKRLIWDDFLKLMERAGLAISERQRGYFFEK